MQKIGRLITSQLKDRIRDTDDATAINSCSASKCTILIVDDSPDIRLLLRVSLGKKYQLLEAGSGTAALELTHLHQPQLILLDVRMPGEVDGLRVLDFVKGDAKLKDIIVGMITAQGQTADELDARERGADAYFIKPFSPRDVVAWVESKLQGATSSRQRACSCWEVSGQRCCWPLAAWAGMASPSRMLP